MVQTIQDVKMNVAPELREVVVGAEAGANVVMAKNGPGRKKTPWESGIVLRGVGGKPQRQI